MPKTSSEFESMLRGAGLRVTRPRAAVLSAVHEHPHADTDSIIRAVRQNLGEVSHQAVYDVLRALTDARLLRRIQPAGLVARYESRVGDNHHHVVCRSCGAIADVDCAVGEAPCLTASEDHGFEIDEAEVIYWARCSECAASEAARDGEARPTDPLIQLKDRHPMAVEEPPPRSTRTTDHKPATEQENDRRV